MVAIALLALLHVLVPVYWLGGDLGAFYGSRFLTDPKRSVPERLLALTILNNVDMAPRTAMILTVPTGLLLAWGKGWLEVPAALVAAVVVGGLVWLAIAWALHLKHGAGAAGLKRVDMAIRYALVLVFVGLGLLGLAHRIELPLFIALKLLIVAVTIALGLLIRRQLVPLFPAIAALRRDGASPEVDAAIAGVIAHTRPVVVLIWVLVLAASLLGFATPN